MFLLAVPMILLYELGILLIGRSSKAATCDAGRVGLDDPSSEGARRARIACWNRRSRARAVGTVYLVGAGPGDPGLLTRRGEARPGAGRRGRLRPSGQPPPARPRPAGRPADLRGQVDRPLHADPGRDQRAPGRARPGGPVGGPAQGGRPARLRPGGRGGVEPSAPPGIPFEIVPGVTAGVGVTAYAGIPVTHRDAASAVAFVTGHDDPESPTPGGRLDWSALARFPGTLVVYMGVTHLAAICRTLIREGKPGDTPAAIVESGTLPSQRTLVGDPRRPRRARRRGRRRPPRPPGRRRRSSACAPALDWFEDCRSSASGSSSPGPPDEAGRGRRPSSRRWAPRSCWRRRSRSGRSPTPGPLDARDRPARRLRLAGLHLGQRRPLLPRPPGTSSGRDLRALGQLKLAAIGPATAEALAGYHLRADLVPDSYPLRGPGRGPGAPRRRGRRSCSPAPIAAGPCSRTSSSTLADVEQVAVYHNADAESLPEAGRGPDRSTARSTGSR